MAVTVSRSRGITTISGGTAEEQKREAQKVIEAEKQAPKPQAVTRSSDTSRMSTRERNAYNEQRLKDLGAGAYAPLPQEQKVGGRATAQAESLKQAESEFIERAQAYGYTQEQARRSLSTGTPLTPSQNPAVQATATELKQQGYTNTEIYDYLETGKLPAKKGLTREDLNVYVPTAPSFQETQPKSSAPQIQPKGVLFETPSNKLAGQVQSSGELREKVNKLAESLTPNIYARELIKGAGEFFVVKPTELYESAVRTVVKPKETATALVSTVGAVSVNPVKAGKEALADFETLSGGQKVGVVGFEALNIVAGSGAFKTFPLKTTSFEIPQSGLKPSSVKSLGLEFGAKSLPIVTLVDDSLRAGSASSKVSVILKNIPDSTDIKIGSASQTTILKNALKEVEDSASPIQKARREELIGVGQSIIKETRGVRSKYSDSLPLETERLNAEGVKTLINIAKEEQATVFGSFSRRAQIPQSISNFVPRDIDIRLRDASPANLDRVVSKAVARLQQAGYPSARRSVDSPEAIEVKLNNDFIKVAEFKGKGLQESVEDAVPEYVLGYAKEGKPIIISGQSVTSLNEELRGVMQGSIRITQKGGVLDIYPPPKRLKDIQSVVISAEALKESKLFNSKLSKDITRFKELFEVDSAPSSTVTSELFDFSPKKRGSASFSPSSFVSSPSVISVSSSPLSRSSSPVLSPSPISISPSPSSRSSSPVLSPSPISISPSPLSGSNSPVPPSPPISILPSPTNGGGSSIFSPIFDMTPTYSYPPYKKRLFESEEPKRKRGFAVFVRKRGVFRQISDKPLVEEEALSVGAREVQRSASATFKLEEAGTATSSGQSSPFDLSKFAKKGNLYIQKAQYRISSSGEKQEITLKGLQAQRTKTLFNKR